MTYAERIAEKANEAELLTAYANATTGADDETLGDAVRTLVANYGGGGSKAWTKLAEIDCSTHTGDIALNGLNGLTEFYIEADKVENASTTESGFNVTKVNGIQVTGPLFPIAKASGGRFVNCHFFFNGLYWDFLRTPGATAKATFGAGNPLGPYNHVINAQAGPANSLTLQAPLPAYVPTSGTITIYGR